MIGRFEVPGRLGQGRHDLRRGLGDEIRRGISLGGIFIPPGRGGDDQVPHLRYRPGAPRRCPGG